MSGIKNLANVNVTGVSCHSKRVKPGDIFVVQANVQAAQYVKEAFERGAVAICSNETFDVPLPHIHQETPIDHLPDLCAEVYGNPGLDLIGVTGTNGKTSVTTLIHYLLSSCDVKTGLIGTVGYFDGKTTSPSIFTTPDTPLLYQLLHQMESNRCTACALEVSSHGLSQNRLGHLKLNTAIFLNLTHDHLDYHKSMEAYAAAKKKIFETLDGTALVNCDDPWCATIAPKDAITFGLNEHADIRALDIKTSLEGTQFTLKIDQKTWRVSSPLVGTYNVYNVLAALGVMYTKGLDLDLSIKALNLFPGISGRLERIPNDQGVHVLVDYAHTPDALLNVLKTLNPLKQGRLITLFGCGGDRDQDKRKVMGEIASSYSDYTVITSDNPRTEDPERIANDIVSGISNAPYHVELDRAKAITDAIAMLSRGDILLIAGKGHEAFQLSAKGSLPFSDTLCAKRVFEKTLCT